MRPITDDVVRDLIEGLETREKNAIAARDAAMNDGVPKGHAATPLAKVAGSPLTRGEVSALSLSVAAMKRRAKKTSREIISYLSVS